jgi:hypothetical protein
VSGPKGTGFDGERYRKQLRASNDPDWIKEELASWERAAKTTLRRRQAAYCPGPDRAEGQTNGAPRSSYRA